MSEADLPSTAALECEFALFAADEHPLEQVSGEVHCNCDRCERWRSFVRTGNNHQPHYLVVTREVVSRLSDWLCDEASAQDGELRVLEVGAGDGTLCFHLQRDLADRAGGSTVRLLATDSGTRGLRPKAGAKVEQHDARNAVAAFEPHIVICSFMPLGQDWTSAFRACAAVHAYLLLGEKDDGCCGSPWATWGFLADGDEDAAVLDVSSTSGSEVESEAADNDNDGRASSPRPAAMRASASKRPRISRRSEPAASRSWRKVYTYEPARTPWGIDGWERVSADVAVDRLSRVLLGCTDEPWNSRRHSCATLFRRVRRAPPAQL